MIDYSDTIYEKWKNDGDRSKDVIRGRVVGIQKGKYRDVWTISSSRRYILLSPIVNRGTVSKGDIIVACAQKNGNGELWVDQDLLMLVKKADKTSFRSNISLYPRDDKLERQNYCLRLLNDEKTLSYVHIRAKIMSSVRRYLENNQYIENCITNVQRNFYGGNSIPFVTHVNYLHKDCFLKPNSQIPFLECLSGGIERMYEISEYYRNGGVDEFHTVPYTAVEIITSYTSYLNIRAIVMDLLCFVFSELGKSDIPFINYAFLEKMKSADYINFFDIANESYNNEYGIMLQETISYEQSKNIYDRFKHCDMKRFERLTFVDFLPDSKSPFIKRVEGKSNYMYRGYAVVNGVNIVEYFEGETDVDQISVKLKSGDDYDNKYERLLNAIRLGIPQYCYITISIDRLISFAVGENNLQRMKCII